MFACQAESGVGRFDFNLSIPSIRLVSEIVVILPHITDELRVIAVSAYSRAALHCQQRPSLIV